MQRRIWIFLGAALVLLAAAAAWWWTQREFSIGYSDAKLVARGQAVYRQHCAACHGVELEGQPDWKSRNERGRLPAPPHDASGHTWHHDDEVLFEVTKYGLGKHSPAGYQSDMPAFGDKLSDDEIVAVLAYIKSRWPEDIHRKRRDAGMT
jgi:mono/diheme cytochrome c family protein